MIILEGSLLSKERAMVLDSKDMSLKFFSAVDLFGEPEGEFSSMQRSFLYSCQ